MPNGLGQEASTTNVLSGLFEQKIMGIPVVAIVGVVILFFIFKK